MYFIFHFTNYWYMNIYKGNFKSFKKHIEIYVYSIGLLHWPLSQYTRYKTMLLQIFLVENF